MPLPGMASEGNWIGRRIGSLHDKLTWTLIAVALLHIGAAWLHFLVYKDHVMQRMLPK